MEMVFFRNFVSQSARLLAIFGLFFLLSGCAEDVVVEKNGNTACNVTFNGQAETGDMTGWNIITNGGSGWAVCQPGTFCTSNAPAEKGQEIDLVTLGFDPADLDSGPDVFVSEDFFRRGDIPDGKSVLYYLKVELRDALHAPIATYDSGWITSATTGAVTENLSHLFTGYNNTSPVRFIHWQDGGDENVGWAGHYGAYLQNATLNVAASSCPIGM